MANDSTNDDRLIISYLTLRKIVGVLGTALPFVLFLGAVIIFGTGIQDSISSYYHTGMRDVFVGTLCVIGFFLLSYKGYEPKDDRAGDLACVFAIGVALFPTTHGELISDSARIIGYVHLIFAAAFFATLIYFSLRLFTKTNPDIEPTDRKKQRNKVYRVCGYTMSVCIILIIFYSLLGDTVSSIKQYAPVFWLEGLAVVAFGISWLTKGEAILRDQANTH
ncbi:MAG: DUF998 domain-containing protein [Woeseia sp.]